ncbi:hypothetical protein DNTS_031803 [Danionella cerebrum]|uniref:CRAL-TRIO domain-containing protein n=1 Tax=Danionella cerebrum TaxID=2873325 RepID=A0A553QCU7_9TELE|nr:hypothetical protein DNTS_031803 [Danionella translucida]
MLCPAHQLYLITKPRPRRGLLTAPVAAAAGYRVRAAVLSALSARSQHGGVSRRSSGALRLSEAKRSPAEMRRAEDRCSSPELGNGPSSSPVPTDHMFTSGAVIFPGAFDQGGSPLVLFPAETQWKLGNELNKEQVVCFIHYCLRLHSIRVEERLLSVVVDLRKADLHVARFITETLLLLEVHFLKELCELFNHVDKSQLPNDLGGFLEISAFVQKFLTVVKRLPFCISNLNLLATRTNPNMEALRELRRELGLDELLCHCECVLQKLRFPEGHECFRTMAGTLLFTHTTRQMLLNHHRLVSAVQKVDLLWHQVSSRAHVLLLIHKLQADAQQICQQICELMRLKVYPCRPEFSVDLTRAEKSLLHFHKSVYVPAMGLVRQADKLSKSLNEMLPASALRLAAPWLDRLNVLKEELNSAVLHLDLTFRRVKCFHLCSNMCQHWYEAVLSEGLLYDLFWRCCDAEHRVDTVMKMKKSMQCRDRVQSFLKHKPCPEEEDMLRLAQLAENMAESSWRSRGTCLAHRCLILRRILLSSGPVSLLDLQRILQWQNEHNKAHPIPSPERSQPSSPLASCLRSVPPQSLPESNNQRVLPSHSNHELAQTQVGSCWKPEASRANSEHEDVVPQQIREASHSCSEQQDLPINSVPRKINYAPSLCSFDSGFGGVPGSLLEIPKYPSGYPEHLSPCNKIQIFPRVNSGSVNLEISVRRSATIPQNPWLSLPINDLEDSYTVSIQPRTAEPPEIARASLSGNVGQHGWDLGTQERELSTSTMTDGSVEGILLSSTKTETESPRTSSVLAHALSSTRTESGHSSYNLSSTLTDTECLDDSSMPADSLSSTLTEVDHTNSLAEGCQSLLWDSFDLHNLQTDHTLRLDQSLGDWLEQEHQHLEHLEETLYRTESIIQEEEAVLEQEVVLDLLLDSYCSESSIEHQRNQASVTLPSNFGQIIEEPVHVSLDSETLSSIVSGALVLPGERSANLDTSEMPEYLEDLEQVLMEECGILQEFSEKSRDFPEVSEDHLLHATELAERERKQGKSKVKCGNVEELDKPNKAEKVEEHTPRLIQGLIDSEDHLVDKIKGSSPLRGSIMTEELKILESDPNLMKCTESMFLNNVKSELELCDPAENEAPLLQFLREHESLKHGRENEKSCEMRKGENRTEEYGCRTSGGLQLASCSILEKSLELRDLEYGLTDYTVLRHPSDEASQLPDNEGSPHSDSEVNMSSDKLLKSFPHEELCDQGVDNSIMRNYEADIMVPQATDSSISTSIFQDQLDHTEPLVAPGFHSDELQSAGCAAKERSPEAPTNTEMLMTLLPCEFDPGGVTPVTEPWGKGTSIDLTHPLEDCSVSLIPDLEEPETPGIDFKLRVEKSPDLEIDSQRSNTVPERSVKEETLDEEGTQIIQSNNNNNNNNCNNSLEQSLIEALKTPEILSLQTNSVVMESVLDSQEKPKTIERSLDHEASLEPDMTPETHGLHTRNRDSVLFDSLKHGQKEHWDRDCRAQMRSSWRHRLQPSSHTQMLASEYKTPVVLDSGSGMIKAGFADQEFPAAVFPSIIGRPKYEEVMCGGEERSLFIGKEAQQMRGVLRLQRPIRQGSVTHWDELEMLWRHAFEQLSLSPDSVDRPLLLTEPVLTPVESRQRAVQMLFDCFGVSQLCVGVQPVLALLSSGCTTGVVLDSGDGLTHSVPVFEGYALPHAVERFSLAGADVTQQLQKLLLERGLCLRSSAEREIVREMKESCCFVALDYDAQLRRRGSEVEFSLPDGRTVSLAQERFQATEILFSPELIGRDHCGLHKSLFRSIQKSDIDLRRSFLENILLAGGNSLLPGLPQRLHRELSLLSPVDQLSCVRVKNVPDPFFSVWQGGAALASHLTPMDEVWISAQEFQEYGPSILHRKCF